MSIPVSQLVVVIARICHEANRAWCEHWGSDKQPSWDDAPQWQKDSALNGVLHIIEQHEKGTPVTAQANHENWMAHKLADGWEYATVKNADKKQHNCLQPYDKLNAKEKLKDKLVLNIVNSFLEPK
jgi:2-succinyl-5-enolpyruvyl-6-hydroxy-3-cyclohexene-1-carboxylate synthase